MKKNGKRILAFMLAAIMLFGAAPLRGIADIDLPKLNLSSLFATKASGAIWGGYIYTTSGREAFITGLSGTGTYASGGRVFIPSTIDNYTVTRIGENAFDDYGSKITDLVIPDSVMVSDGCTEYTCPYCNHSYREITPAYNHDYVVEYSWAKNGSYCNATATCKNDPNHVITESGTITSDVKTPAGCETKGVTTYTATFKSDVFTSQVIDITNIPASGHRWKYSTGANTITVSCANCTESYTVAAYVPQNCKCSDKVKTVTVVETLPDGFKTNVSYVTADGKAPKTAGTYTAYFDLLPIGLTDNIYARVELTIVIDHDLAHHVGQAATCDGDGWKAYDTCNGCDYSTYQVIPAKNHDYVVSYNWSEDNKSCTAVATCANDATHTFSETATATSNVKIKPTCTEMGTTTYTAAFNNKFFTPQTKDVVNIPATNHSFTEYAYQNDATLTSDGTKLAHCDHDGCNKVDIKPAEGTMLLTDIHIRNYKKYNGSTQKYKTTITFYYDLTNDPGNKVEWKVTGAQFEINSDGSCTVKQATGDYSIFCQVTDANGRIVKSEDETVHIKHGFIDKLLGFFRGIFGVFDVFKQD